LPSELAKLGHGVDKDTVAKYMPRPPRRPRRPPSQTRKTFIRNHLTGTIAIDFLTVPTVTFDTLRRAACSSSGCSPQEDLTQKLAVTLGFEGRSHRDRSAAGA
jgi:hypothetical protein